MIKSSDCPSGQVCTQHGYRTHLGREPALSQARQICVSQQREERCAPPQSSAAVRARSHRQADNRLNAQRASTTPTLGDVARAEPERPQFRCAPRCSRYRRQRCPAADAALGESPTGEDRRPNRIDSPIGRYRPPPIDRRNASAAGEHVQCAHDQIREAQCRPTPSLRDRNPNSSSDPFNTAAEI